MTMLLCVATIAAGIVSCGNNAKKDVEETPTSYSQTRANRGNVGDALPICNTKWGFTDAQGNRFTLTIKEMARDGKSAKMELEKNGMVVVYGTVGPDWLTDYVGYGFAGGGDNLTEERIYYSQANYDWICHAKWDIDEGFLYSGINDYNAESTIRLKVNRIK